MITIDNPILEKQIISKAKEKWVSVENYIFYTVTSYRENKTDLLEVAKDTKKNWKSFNNIDDLFNDLEN